MSVVSENAQGRRWRRTLGMILALVGTAGCCGSAVAVGLADYKGEVVSYALYFGWFFWAMTLIGLAFWGLHFVETRRRRSRAAEGLPEGRDDLQPPR
jgi:hypothetical protein